MNQDTVRMFKRLTVSCYALVIIQMTVSVSGQSCFVKFQNGSLIQEGNCETQRNQQVFQDLTRNTGSKALSALPKDCKDVRPKTAKIENKTGGVYDINFPGVGKLDVFCDTKTDGGGWTVVQRRMDGSVDFYLNWADYQRGFGRKQGEFWLGLETIHQMTKNKDNELRIDMIRTDGVQYYTKYRFFSIGPACDHYRLSVSGYSGNATDELLASYSLNNTKFSTRDSDNDESFRNCAMYLNAAWWYRNCAWSNLNGVYGRSNFTGIFWSSSYHYMSFTEMKLRKRA